MAGLGAATRLGLVVAVGALVGLLLTAGRSAEATGPAAVRLTDLQTKLTRYGDGVGSGEVARLTLFGSKNAKRAIGHAIVTCTFVGANERSCQASYILPRGTIETAGVLRSRLIYTHAVVGGTGFYNNARGTLTVTAKSLKPRREILLFRLTG